MSKYEEEKGSVVLPSTQVVPLRNELTALINTDRAKTFQLAERIHAHLTTAQGKDDRKRLNDILKKISEKRFSEDTLDSFFSDMIKKLSPAISQRYRSAFEDEDEEQDLDYHRSITINQLILKQDQETKRFKLQSPKKKDFPLFSSSKTDTWRQGELFIKMNAKERRFTWSIPENNHSVDRAHDTPLGRLFFQALDKMQWTRNTGGTVRYTNEYMRDNMMERDGGDGYSERGYGPIGEASLCFRLGLGRGQRSNKKTKK